MVLYVREGARKSYKKGRGWSKLCSRAQSRDALYDIIRIAESELLTNTACAVARVHVPVVGMVCMYIDPFFRSGGVGLQI